MRLPPSFYELLKSRINISDVVRQRVSLTKKAGRYYALCPFHHEKTPSFSINDSRGFYHCFGCGVHGDIINFTSEIMGLSPQDAAIKLAEDYGIELPKLTVEQEKLYQESDEIYRILSLAADFFKNNLSKDVLKYLESRKISQSLIREFDIGFAPSGGKLQKFFAEKSIPALKLINAGLIGKRESGTIYELFAGRIVFPIKNAYGKVIGFGGRVMGDGLPKYINSPETLLFKKSENLYGENFATSAGHKKNRVILVEGYLDVIALNKAGFNEAVASLGTAVTEGHLRKLWRIADEIVVCLDADAAGEKASRRLIDLALPLLNAECSLTFVLMPKGKDPDDVINNYGSEYFKNLTEQKITLSERIWQLEYDGKEFQTAEARANLETTLNAYCKKLQDRTLNSNYWRFFKDRLWRAFSGSNKKWHKNTKISPPPTALEYSDEEFLEYAMAAIMVKFPILLLREEVLNFLSHLEFNNPALNEFQQWFFTNVSITPEFTTENIKDCVEKTRFFELFLLLSKPDSPFLDTSFNNTDYEVVWNVLSKKHHLTLLKKEYAKLMQSSDEAAFTRALMYRDEMLKTTKELQALSESVTLEN